MGRVSKGDFLPDVINKFPYLPAIEINLNPIVRSDYTRCKRESNWNIKSFRDILVTVRIGFEKPQTLSPDQMLCDKS